MGIKYGLFAVGMILLSTGCTPYKADGLMGGYAETPLSADTYHVTFRGNGYTSEARTRTGALVRAAELTLESGYDRFIILKAGVDTRTSAINIPGSYTESTTARATMSGNHLYGTATTSGTYTPGTSIDVERYTTGYVIKMVKMDHPYAHEGLDPRKIIEKYGAEFGIKVPPGHGSQ